MTAYTIALVTLPLWAAAMAYGVACALRAASHAVAGWWWRRNFAPIRDRRLGTIGRRR